MGERGVHEISTVVYVNAQFGVPVSHNMGMQGPAVQDWIAKMHPPTPKQPCFKFDTPPPTRTGKASHSKGWVRVDQYAGLKR